jgi:hypothetical protein
MTISPGHRFEGTQALRQVLARAVVWGMIDSNPAKQGVDNPQRRRTEKRPFESWAQLGELAARLGSRYGPPVLFAAATGLRPGEWMALEQRDIDRRARVAYVRRALRNGRLESTKTEGSIRAVPLQAIGLAALDQLRADRESQLLFPSPRGGYFDLHNFRNRYWTPQIAASIAPPRRLYDLRHTFATFALRAGISTFDPLALLGSQPDHDRPPLRPPRPRRTRARNPTAPVRSDAEIQRQRDEEIARKAADLHWLDEGFQYAKQLGAKGVLIDWQADPNFNNENHPANPHDFDAFPDHINALRTEMLAFSGQVVLVHGDSHYFKVDKPLKLDSGRVLGNFTRVETFGAASTDWMQATIDPRSRNLFVFAR